MTHEPVDIDLLGRASRRTALLTFLGVAIVLTSLGYSGYQIKKLDQALSAKKENLKNLQNQEQKLKEEVVSAQAEYRDLRKNIEKLYSIQVTPQNDVYEIKATAKATGKLRGNALPEYQFSLYINSPRDVLSKIEKVTYHIDHPSFSVHSWDETNGSTGFKTQWLGWGCLREVRVDVFLKDKSKRSLDFDMCKGLGAGWG